MQIAKPQLAQSRINTTFFFVEFKFHSTYSFNSAIRTHLNSANPEKATTLFLNLRKKGLLPDNFSIPSLLKLFNYVKQSPLDVDHIHAFAIKSGYLPDAFVRTALIELYFKRRRFSASCHVFEEIPQRDVVLWTAMVSGFSQSGLGYEALNFFSRMLQEKLKPNQITVTSILSVCSQLMLFNLGKAVHGFSIRNGLLMVDFIVETAFVDMYGKTRNLSYASRVFDHMRERNSVAWNAIITSYAADGLYLITLQMFRDMIWGGWRQPKSSTLAAVLQVCGETMDLLHGRVIHGHIVRCRSGNIREDESLVEYNSLINMYVKSGNLEIAELLFKKLDEKNLVTWTIMIAGYGMHGLSSEALKAFSKMRNSGIRPDGITFIALLSACSHGGLVEQGHELYISMNRDYNIVPEMKHFVCMVDMYGRAGLINEAYNFVVTMPVEPSEFIWASLLSSCRNHKNLELGKYAAKKAIALDMYNVGYYILLARIYADLGQWEDVSKIRLIMKELGLKPSAAVSWVESKRRLYTFTVGDSSKRCMKRLSESMGIVMEQHGFVSDTSCVGRNINEEDKLSDLCGHTEKLALAFALRKSVGTIRIGKNLRVCRDCHEAFKYISKISNREIILRDPNRYHRFREGLCSCCDYW